VADIWARPAVSRFLWWTPAPGRGSRHPERRRRLLSSSSSFSH